MDTADAISVELDDAIEALTRLSRQLRQRATSNAWMKPTDHRWQQRWADVLAHHGRTGRWPRRDSDDPEEKSQAGWVGFQRKQHRNQRLNPEREAMMRAAGSRFTAYPGHRATDEGTKQGR